MIDMGQADRTLRATPKAVGPGLSYIRALQFAACSMGFDHYVDVPDGDVAALKEKALQIQRDHGKLPMQTPVAAG